MNVSLIVGLLLTSFSAIVLLAGFISGNMYYNNGVAPSPDTSRDTAPGCFWATAAWWMLLAIVGAAIVIMSWGK